jgi:catechol 2,3-dioxygenase-like lactoylglutathione lyase family enzyme
VVPTLKLNHVDLQVSNVDVAREFFENHFGLRRIYQRAGQLALLKDDAGLELGVSNLRCSPPPTYPSDFHVGFVLDRADAVRKVYARFRDGGVRIKMELREGGPNLFFVCEGPEGIPIEIRAPRDS